MGAGDGQRACAGPPAVRTHLAEDGLFSSTLSFLSHAPYFNTVSHAACVVTTLFRMHCLEQESLNFCCKGQTWPIWPLWQLCHRSPRAAIVNFIYKAGDGPALTHQP